MANFRCDKDFLAIYDYGSDHYVTEWMNNKLKRSILTVPDAAKKGLLFVNGKPKFTYPYCNTVPIYHNLAVGTDYTTYSGIYIACQHLENIFLVEDPLGITYDVYYVWQRQKKYKIIDAIALLIEKMGEEAGVDTKRACINLDKSPLEPSLDDTFILSSDLDDNLQAIPEASSETINFELGLHLSPTESTKTKISAAESNPGENKGDMAGDSAKESVDTEDDSKSSNSDTESVLGKAKSSDDSDSGTIDDSDWWLKDSEIMDKDSMRRQNMILSIRSPEVDDDDKSESPIYELPLTPKSEPETIILSSGGISGPDIAKESANDLALKKFNVEFEKREKEYMKKRRIQDWINTTGVLGGPPKKKQCPETSNLGKWLSRSPETVFDLKEYDESSAAGPSGVLCYSGPTFTQVLAEIMSKEPSNLGNSEPLVMSQSLLDLCTQSGDFDDATFNRLFADDEKKEESD